MSDAPVEKVLMVEPGTGVERSIRVDDQAAWEAKGYTLAGRVEAVQPDTAPDEPVGGDETPEEPSAEPEQPSGGVTFPRRTSRRSAG